MDLQDLKRLALAAREFSMAAGSVQFTLRIPTQHEVTIASRRSGIHALQDDAAAHVVLQRALLLLAVVGWSGLTVADVLPGQPPEPLEWSAGAIELVLDTHPEWEAKLASALIERMAARQGVKDTAAKN
jgi:hypothetical protein